jgi:hypothetical protein
MEETEAKGLVTGRLWCAYVGHRMFIGLSDGPVPGIMPGIPSGRLVLEDALEALVHRENGPKGMQVRVALVPVFPSNEPIPRLQLTPDITIKAEGDESLENYYKTATHRTILVAPSQGQLQFP